MSHSPFDGSPAVSSLVAQAADLDQRITLATAEAAETAALVDETAQALRGLRSAAILGEADDEAVKAAEAEHAGALADASRIADDLDALRGARERVEGRLGEARADARAERLDSIDAEARAIIAEAAVAVEALDSLAERARRAATEHGAAYGYGAGSVGSTAREAADRLAGNRYRAFRADVALAVDCANGYTGAPASQPNASQPDETPRTHADEDRAARVSGNAVATVETLGSRLYADETPPAVEAPL